MLDKLRKPTKTKSSFKAIVIYSIFGLICFSFVFMGITPDTGTFTGGGAAATVNDTSISLTDFRERVSMAERQMGDSFRDLPAAQRRQMMSYLNQNVIEEMINMEVVVQASHRLGIFPSNAAVRDMILGIPAFQQNGRFSRETYDGYLTATGQSAGRFEERLRKDVVLSQMRDTLFRALRAPKSFQKLEAQAKNTQLNIGFVRIAPSQLDVSGLITQREVNEFLGSPEGEAQALAFYENNAQEFTSEAEVKARHVLIKTEERSSAEALERILEIKEELGESSFEDLARRYSEDEGSKPAGGDLGYFSRGRMVPEFESVAFSLPVGEVSEPVLTDFGYHIIKVEDRRGGDVPPFEGVSSDIARRLLERDIRDRQIKEVQNATNDQRQLASLLRRLNLEWDETGSFSLDARMVPKIGDNPSVVTSALKLQGQTPEFITSGGEHYLVRINDLKRGDSDIDNDEMMGGGFSMAAMDVFNRWAEERRESAKVRINEAVLDVY